MILGSREQIARLPEFGLEGDIVEEFEDVDIVLLLLEVLLEQQVYGAFEHEGIVDCNHSHLGHEIPARAAPTSLGAVHDVVGHEEEGLEQLDEPAQQSGVEELIVGELAVEEQLRGVDDREAAVALAAERVVV